MKKEDQPMNGKDQPAGNIQPLSFHDLLHKILFYAHGGLPRNEFLEEVSHMVLQFSRCDAIELWIKDRGKLVRSLSTTGSTAGSQKKSPRFPGNIPSKSSDDERLERIYQALLFTPLDLAGAQIKRKGSLFITHFDESSDSANQYDRILADINRGGYRSLCIVPLSAGEEHVGLLQLKSMEPHYFSGEDFHVYEDMAHSLGAALAHRNAQISLRERVKELTCLYGTARVVAHSHLSAAEQLQEIVRLLPTAWLYPEITSARILIDGDDFVTDNFSESPFKMSAPVIIGGEKRGTVEVFYREDMPELDEGPFLKEERALLDAMAKEIALAIERKNADDEKARVQEQLRHADRLATIGQLAAGVAHELNEPLGSILGFAQLVRKIPDLPGQAGQDIDRIITASLHAREVVRKLLIFSRQTLPKKMRVKLNELIVEGMYFVNSRCARSGIQVVMDLCPSLPEITADPGQMNQILINLAVNAIQSMQEIDGRTLTIKTFADARHVYMVVQDTGSGMTGDVLSKIFIPFFTTKDIGQGTGLGLPVVHGIVTSHGGEIKVESTPGAGTRFIIQLPINNHHVSREC